MPIHEASLPIHSFYWVEQSHTQLLCICALAHTLPATRNQGSSRPHLKMWMCNPVICPDWAENLYGANSELSRFSLLFFLLALLGEKKAFQPPAADPGWPFNFTREEVICSLFASCLISSSLKSTHCRSSRMFLRRNRFLWFMVKGPCLFSLSGQQLRSQCFIALVKSQLIAPPQEHCSSIVVWP